MSPRLPSRSTRSPRSRARSAARCSSRRPSGPKRSKNAICGFTTAVSPPAALISPSQKRRRPATSSVSPAALSDAGAGSMPRQKGESSSASRSKRSANDAIGLPQGPAEALDALAGVLQQRVGGGIRDAQVRAEAEGRAVHRRDALALEELGDEVLVGLEGLAGRGLAPDGLGTGWIDVERALRHGGLQVLRLIEHRDDEVAALLEGLLEDGEVILRPVERQHRGPLRYARRARGLLPLDEVHGLDELLGARGVADAPPGHRISLGDAVHGQRALVQRRLDLGRGDELEVAVDEVLVHVVGKYPD